MHKGISIRPSGELKNNYSQLSELARMNPVAITVNGKEDMVIMSHESFMAQQNRVHELELQLAVYEHLAQARYDVKLGRTHALDTAFDEILGELGEITLQQSPVDH